MGVKTIQTCDNCGDEREIVGKGERTTDGWRGIDSNSIEITLCRDCTHELVFAVKGKSCSAHIGKPVVHTFQARPHEVVGPE